MAATDPNTTAALANTATIHLVPSAITYIGPADCNCYANRRSHRDTDSNALASPFYHSDEKTGISWERTRD
jgi:hypothetical protein